MKDKLIQIRADAEFLAKLEYLQTINGFKSTSETIRQIVDKEFRKEHKRGDWITCWDVMGENEDGYKCTKCGGIAEEKSVYCPNCGARMK